MNQSVDVARVVETNEQVVFGKTVLFVALEAGLRSEKLLVVMNTHNQGGEYMALRSFLENQKCDLLFVCDPANSWYLDRDQGEGFLKTINEFAENYKPHSIFLYGFSMSGYGALFHAFKLNANAIICNPQINLDITKDYSWPELVEHIDDLEGRHVNLDEIAGEVWSDSAVYVIHGHDEMDVINVDLLTKAAPPNKKLIIQTLDVDLHSMFFGRDVGYVYEVIDLLSSFRVKLDLKKLLSALILEDKTNKRQLRAERKLAKIHDPYRVMDHSCSTVSWQNRYLYQQVGRKVFFSNVGFYSGAQLTGGACFFDGERWRLCAPLPSINDDLMTANVLKTDTNVSAFKNNQHVNEHWWIRNESGSEVFVLGGHDCFEIKLSTVNAKNIYLGTTLKAGGALHDGILGKYLTLSADVFTSVGQVSVTLGGVGDSGHHHSSSPKNTAGSWRNIFVVQQFLSIKTDHKDSIFVRINLAVDGEVKNVLVKNIRLYIGYFPMGLA